MYRENINKIHFELSNQYNVVVNERSNLTYGNYIELIITEGRRELSIILKKEDLNDHYFNWVYKANPLDNDSVLVERSSNLDTFTSEINTIFKENRFDRLYLETLNIPVIEVIEDSVGQYKGMEIEGYKTMESCPVKDWYKVMDYLLKKDITDYIYDHRIDDLNNKYDITVYKKYLNFDEDGESVLNNDYKGIMFLTYSKDWDWQDLTDYIEK